MMNNKVFNNAAWIIACRIIKVLLATLVSVFTARMLGPDNYGILNFASSVTSFISPFVLLGFNSILVNELLSHNNIDDEGTITGTAIISSIICALFGIILSAVIAYMIDPSDKIAIGVTIVYSTSLIFHSLELIQYWFQAKYRSNAVALVGVVAYVVVSIYKILLLVLSVSIYWFAFSNALDYLIISGVLLYLYYKENNPKLRYSRNVFRHLISIGKYYMISSLMVTIFTKVDKLMIKSLLGNQENGLYAVAVTCSGMFTFVFAAVIEAMRPYILEAKNESNVIFEKRLGALYSILIYSGIACSTVVTLFADIIIKVVYGSAYSGASSSLKILIWYTSLSCIGGAKDIWILAERKQRYLMLLNTAGVITNVLLNIVLIPIYGINGAAIATLITQFFSNIFICLFIKDLRHNIWILWKSLNPSVLLVSYRLLSEKVKVICKG